jgi:hypothetical protein
MVCFTSPEAAEAIKLHLKMNKDDHEELFYFKTPKNLTMTLRQIQIRSGVGQVHNTDGEIVGQARNSIPAVHGLKKFCITQLAKSKVDTEIAKVLTDHSIGVRSSYVEYTDDDLLAEYLKAVNNLTINEENRLKTRVDILEEKESEIEKLREQLKSVQANVREQVEQELKNSIDEYFKDPNNKLQQALQDNYITQEQSAQLVRSAAEIKEMKKQMHELNVKLSNAMVRKEKAKAE